MTHAFVGAAMAEYAVPRHASPRTRAGLLCLGVVAANAPDVDLLYTGITEAPLGYLLHHRGHSHTLTGLAVLAILIASSLWLFRSSRSAMRGDERRWIVLIGAALASHLLMDSANGYGTHPFHPFSSRWLYVDAVFVLEPWLWAILGTAVALNAARRGRVAVALVTLFLIGALAAVGLLPVQILALMLVVVSAAALATRDWERKRRALTALVATFAIFALMPLVSRAAKAQARAALDGVDDSAVIDTVADANPGVPWCWGVLMLHRSGGDASGTLIARRGTLSLFYTRPIAATLLGCVAALITFQVWQTRARGRRFRIAGDEDL